MDNRQKVEQDSVPDDENVEFLDELEYEDGLDYQLDKKFTDLLAFVKEQKEKHAGKELGRHLSILFTELEKAYAFSEYFESLDQ